MQDKPRHFSKLKLVSVGLVLLSLVLSDFDVSVFPYVTTGRAWHARLARRLEQVYCEILKQHHVQPKRN